MNETPREECGLFGIYFKAPLSFEHLVGVTLTGLLVNQHRGEESAGIGVANGKEVLPLFKRMGLVRGLYQAYLRGNQKRRKQKGLAAIAHTRYSTTGSSNIANAAPFLFHLSKLGSLAVAHNGNITNALGLKKELQKKGCRFSSTTDSEVIGNLILSCSGRSWEEKMVQALNRLQGSFSLLLLTKDAVFGARDPMGNRPLSYAEFLKDGLVGYALSSETPAFDSLGIHYQREIKQGELIKFSQSGLRSRKFSKKILPAFCALEIAYLMRPDSRIQKIQLDTVRRRLGAILAKNHPVPKGVDWVTYIPESARSAAEGFAEEIAKITTRPISMRTAMLKGRYGTIDGAIRGFINPCKTVRNAVAHTNYFPFDWLIGKKIVLVDDSIIRGTTTGAVVGMLRDKVGYLKNAGAAEVHVRIIFPPVVGLCPLGTDINKQDFLIARELKKERKIARYLTADSLAYLSVAEFTAGVKEVLGKDFGLCLGCTTGSYPVTDFAADKSIFEK